MANFTDHMEDLIVNVMRGLNPTVITQLGVGLFVGGVSIEADLEQGIVTSEVSTSGTAYSRKIIALNAPSNGMTNNDAEIAWPAATADWGTVSHFGIFDDASNLLMWGPLTAPKTVNTNDVFKFPIGYISVAVQ